MTKHGHKHAPSASKFAGEKEMGMFMSPADCVKCLAKIGVTVTEGQADVNKDGHVLFEQVWKLCDAKGKTDEVPRGASFTEKQWATFQDWWKMRQIYATVDKDGSGCLDMKEVCCRLFARAAAVLPASPLR